MVRRSTAPRHRVAPTAALVAGVVALVVGTAGCAREEFPDRTAEVRVGGDRRTYQVVSCGLDEHTAFLVARADDGALLQAVVGLEDDDATGVPASTGLTVDLRPERTDTRIGAFGAEAWARRGEGGAAPGEVRSARLRGSRIQLTADAVGLDEADRPLPSAEPQPVSVDARCDERDDGAPGAGS
ncbi:MAG: hypothetical protein KDB04_08555 [Acidimicrobiales bacterium]|mgnify:CR=1 FL=1|nr:hypothetical protein [Acidimicrobiales bacterium]HRW37378.1 hypothetical protein [Aquihabitans sp.]